MSSADADEVVRVIPIRGELDAAAAARVRAAFLALPEGSHVVLDFSEAREISLLGLCALGNAILTAAADLHVVQRGLPRHEERVLQYLGIAALRAPVEEDPA